MPARFTESMAVHILTNDENPSRFEDFCVELFRDVDQIEYARTSRSWDRGRDGLGASPLSGTVPPFICCSLRDDAMAKAIEDAKRIIEDAKPSALVICCARRVSEDAAIPIEAAVKAIIGQEASVRVNGQGRLTQLSIRYPRAFERFYAAEIAELEQVFREQSAVPLVDQLTGLRVALTTQLHGDAQARKNDVIRNLILSSLATRNRQTVDGLCAFASQALHLPRKINTAFLRPEIETLKSDQMLTERDTFLELTDIGQAEIKSRQVQGEASLTLGQAEVRVLIEQLTGAAMSPEEWRSVWRILQDGLSAMFMDHGAQIVDSIASILDDATKAGDHKELLEHINGMAARIEALPGGGARVNEIAQAVRDMFAERRSAAFDWLVDLCSIYIDMCSLGLESHSQAQIIDILKSIALVLDTDIILSLLSEGEGNHIEVEETINGWRRLGGELFVSAPSLEECAHHARVAEYEYQGSSGLLASMTDEEALRKVDNVFVRGFRIAAKGKINSGNWQKYMRAFRGRDEADFEKLLGLLQDYGIRQIAESPSDGEIVKRVEERLYEMRTANDKDKSYNHAVHEKCNRDARLAALVIGLRMRLHSEGKAAVAVSTSKALRLALSQCEDIKFQHGPEPAMFLSGITWLLSLVPGARLSVGALKGVLFDSGIRRRFPRIERHVMRIVQASSEYDVHWSRRNTLYQAVRGQLGKLASERGQPQRQVEAIAVTDTEEGRAIMTRVVAEALDEVARSRSEGEVTRLSQRVQELEELLVIERKKRR